MQYPLQRSLSASQLAELSAVLGPAPVLSTEDEASYQKIWNSYIECLKPGDGMELELVRVVQNETWKILRFTRHQTVAIERHSRDYMKFQVRRANVLKARKEAAAEQPTEGNGQASSELNRLLELEDTVWEVAVDGDRLLERTPSEIDHNRALETAIAFLERLDKLINSAQARRNDALRMLEIYRDGLGAYWRRASDDIIGIASSKSEELEEQMTTLPLTPLPEDDDEMSEEGANPGAASRPGEDDDLDQEDA